MRKSINFRLELIGFKTYLPIMKSRLHLSALDSYLSMYIVPCEKASLLSGTLLSSSKPRYISHTA